MTNYLRSAIFFFFFFLKIQSFRLIMEYSISFGCVALSAILLKPNVTHNLLFNFYEQKFVQHGPITIANECFRRKLAQLCLWTKSGPNQNCYSFWVRRLFNVCVRVFCASNATILLVYIPAKSFIWKDNFFLPKSASCVSRSVVCRIHNRIRSAEG